MSAWLPWIYHYGVGGLLFAVSVAIMLRAGALRISHPAHRRLLITLVVGLLGFMAAHAVWIVLATQGG